MGLNDKLRDKRAEFEDMMREKVVIGPRGAAVRDKAREARLHAPALAEARQRRFEEVQASCPFPIESATKSLPHGLKLFDDEFLVTRFRDMGITTKKLILTTHRLIYAKGTFVSSRDMRSVYLSDIRTVHYHRPLMGVGRANLTVETGSGRDSVEGLPHLSATKAVRLRDDLMKLIHWARQNPQGGSPSAPESPGTPPKSPESPPASDGNEDIAGKLKQLAELRDSGIVSQEEFDTKRAELLSRL